MRALQHLTGLLGLAEVAEFVLGGSSPGKGAHRAGDSASTQRAGSGEPGGGFGSAAKEAFQEGAFQEDDGGADA